jgi:[glutamine synthetase] adenylyltransferase / [glutamine synthetase]-adenylyl-L-tyrosine phosphorylase
MYENSLAHLNASEQRIIQRAIDCSPFFARMIFAKSGSLDALVKDLYQPFTRSQMESFLKQEDALDERILKRVVRQLRQQVILRIIARDLGGLADLDEVMTAMTDLAEVVIDFALPRLYNNLTAIYGTPINLDQSPMTMSVIGMGKLGGRELNVSSDIDLIFAYEEEGETKLSFDTQRKISHHDFFTRLAKSLIAVIDEVNEDGYVFRVDMRLRPYGSEGPLVCSLDMMEAYYQNQGREWERYAWIKGRVIYGKSEAIENLIKPFVFRKYLDYGAIASIRDLKQKIRQDVSQKGMIDNIKLGRGGIREIEFIAQVFQLIRGGQDASLQVKPTQAVLALIGQKNLLPAQTVETLLEAYIFLRNLEHRLQYLEDQQTQNLPHQEESQHRLAL